MLPQLQAARAGQAEEDPGEAALICALTWTDWKPMGTEHTFVLKDQGFSCQQDFPMTFPIIAQGMPKHYNKQYNKKYKRFQNMLKSAMKNQKTKRTFSGISQDIIRTLSALTD